MTPPALFKNPTFIGIGVQKCASTWIYAALRGHPQVWVAPAKELNFFSYYYPNGYQWYERHFISPEPRRASGEISPSYFYNPQAITRIHRYNPQMKLLVSLRDPIDRAYSNHLHEVRAGRYQSVDNAFEGGLANNELYLEQSRYAKYLRQWYDYFPSQQILVLFQEEIRADAARECQRLYQFLGLEPIPATATLTQAINPSYIPKSRWLDQTLNRLGSALRAKGGTGLVQVVKATGLLTAIRAVNQQPPAVAVPPLRPETEQRLIAEFRPEVEALKQVLGRETLPWRRW